MIFVSTSKFLGSHILTKIIHVFSRSAHAEKEESDQLTGYIADPYTNDKFSQHPE
jgi:hypothetical protein